MYLISKSPSLRTVSTRIEGHAKVSGPKRFVNGGEVEIHASEWFHCVVIRFDFHVTHLTQPEVHSFGSILTVVHSFGSILTVFVEEAAVASE